MKKVKASCKCLPSIMLDSVKGSQKYYPQTLLEECKNETKRLKWRFLLMLI